MDVKMKSRLIILTRKVRHFVLGQLQHYGVICGSCDRLLCHMVDCEGCGLCRGKCARLSHRVENFFDVVATNWGRVVKDSQPQ